MNEEIEISIILPVYNTALRLRRAIDSLLAQTASSFEVIVVNDGSTDASTEICREYAAKHPGKLILIEGPNGGVSVARNKGLDAAKGKWIGFADSDDYVEPDLYEYLHSRTSPEIDLSSCAMTCENGEKRELRTNLKTSGEEIRTHEAVMRTWIRPLLRQNASAYSEAHGYLVLSLFRREIIEKNRIRFIPKLTVLEDEVFYLEYLPHVKNAALSDKPLYHYIFSENSACATTFQKRTLSFLKEESNWYKCWNQRLGVYRKSELEKEFPRAGLFLLVNTFFHEANLICFSGDISFPERLKNLKNKREEFKRSKEYTENKDLSALTKKQRLFIASVNCGILPLFLFCLMGRIAKHG